MKDKQLGTKHLNSSKENILLGVFFIVLLVYFRVVQSFGMTDVHIDSSDLYTRNLGMYLSFLDFGASESIGEIFHKVRLFCDYALLCRHAALQFVVLAAYFSLIGDLFPLTPWTMLFPHAVIAALIGVFAYKLGRVFKSVRFGIIFALTIVLLPWVAVAARFSEMYSLLIVLMELAVLYYYTNFIRDPDNKRSRIMAPLTLAGYLTTGLNWPIFIVILSVYLAICKKFRLAIRNPYNVFPILVVVLHALFTLMLYLGDAFYWSGMYGRNRWQIVFLVYPFYKVFTKFGHTVLNYGAGVLYNAMSYVYHSYGIAWFVAVFAAILYVYRSIRYGRGDTDWRRKLAFMIACWLIIISFPFIKSGNDHLTYAFCMAVPTAFIASLFMEKFRLPVAVSFILLMGVMQWCVFLNCLEYNAKGYGDDYRALYRHDNDKRVLAISDFLIERHPELLEKDKTALTPYYMMSSSGHPAYIGDYVCGGFARLRPWFLDTFEEGIPVQLYNYMKARNWEHGKDLLNYIDWVVLSSELIKHGLHEYPASAYYRKLLSDPSIDWLARFRENNQLREFYLGRVIKDKTIDNTPLKDAPVYDVDELARDYEKKYDRLSYLKKGLKQHIPEW